MLVLVRRGGVLTGGIGAGRDTRRGRACGLALARRSGRPGHDASLTQALIALPAGRRLRRSVIGRVRQADTVRIGGTGLPTTRVRCRPVAADPLAVSADALGVRAGSLAVRAGVLIVLRLGGERMLGELGEPVGDRIRERGRQIREDPRHAAVEVVHAYHPLGERVPHLGGEVLRRHRGRDLAGHSAHPTGRLRRSRLEGEPLVRLASTFVRDADAGAHDGPDMTGIHSPSLPRLERRDEAGHERGRIAHAALGRAVRDPHGHSELQRDLAQRQIRIRDALPLQPPLRDPLGDELDRVREQSRFPSLCRRDLAARVEHLGHQAVQRRPPRLDPLSRIHVPHRDSSSRAKPKRLR